MFSGFYADVDDIHAIEDTPFQSLNEIAYAAARAYFDAEQLNSRCPTHDASSFIVCGDDTRAMCSVTGLIDVPSVGILAIEGVHSAGRMQHLMLIRHS